MNVQGVLHPLEEIKIPIQEEKPLFSAYWCGYRDDGIPTNLNDLPDSIDYIPLAFGTLEADSTISLDQYLCKNNDLATIQKWIQEVRAKGKKVVISLGQTPTTSFADVDPEKLATSAKELMEVLHLDGFDFNAEGRNLNALTLIILTMRKTLGEEAIITYTCYNQTDEEKQILESCKEAIDWIQTMSYGQAYGEMIKTAKYYEKIMGRDKVAIGVKYLETPVHECHNLAKFIQENDFRAMMFWSADADNKSFTSRRKWTWCNAIEKGLRPPLPKTPPSTPTATPRKLRARVSLQIGDKSDEFPPSPRKKRGRKCAAFAGFITRTCRSLCGSSCCK